MKTKESNVKKDKKAYLLAFLTAMSIFAMGQIAGSIDSAIAMIGEEFNLSSSNTMYVSSIAALASVIFGLIIGTVAGKKFSYKSVLYFSAVMVLAGGILPFFAKNYILLLFFRLLFGIGYGGMMSLENPFVALTIPKEKRAFALGIGMFIGYGTNCLLQFIGGLLADIQWNYVFLNHLLLLIPFFIIIFCCPNIPKVQESTDIPNKKEDNKKKKKTSIFNSSVIAMCILMALVGLLISPLLIGCSFLSANINPSATVAGIVAVCFSIGCMIGGIIYPKLLKKLGHYSFTTFLVIATIGMAGSALANNIPVLCIMILLGGMGFSTTQTTAMTVISSSVSEKDVTMASSIMMALFNLGMFLSSPFQALVGNITGDAVYTPLYIGAIIFTIAAIIFVFYNPFAKNDKENNEK